MTNLHEHYLKTVRPQLIEKFCYKTRCRYPHRRRSSLNMGLGEAIGDNKILEHAVADLPRSPGRSRSSPARKKSIANFKLREGYPSAAR